MELGSSTVDLDTQVGTFDISNVECQHSYEIVDTLERRSHTNRTFEKLV